ncbi:MAG: efflux RND transporter permease subunit [candidate division WOR-3 bacterium]|nr:MAG: efflux RND transporter permease subunit [candidate division WOR-3 bacterium]
MRLTDSSIRRPVTTGMVVLALFLFGIIGVTRMQVDFYPDVTFPMVVVATPYPGAGPLEVESEVTDPLEEGLGTITGLTDITSTSSENISAIMLQFDWGTNLDAAASDIRDRLDMAQTGLPEDVQKPFVFKFDPSMMPVLQLGMAGDIDETELADIAEEISERLQRVPGVAAVNVGGQVTRQVHIDLDLREFANSGVTTEAFAMALKAQNLNFPIGDISTDEQRYLIRLIGQYDELDAIRNTVVGARRDGSPVLVRHVARVSWAPEERDALVRMDGKNSIYIWIQRRPDANTIQVSDALLREARAIEKDLPTAVDFKVFWDSAEPVRNSVNAVAMNLILGGVLASMVLFLFLRRFRATMFVAFAIPASVFFALFGMFLAGFTLNILSMAGLAIAVGMVVDNGVVVFENIFRRREGGEEAFKAASEGTSTVAMAITASTLTTIAVFLPLLLLKGILRVFFKDLAFAIIFALISSLGIALTLIPMLSSRFLKMKPPGARQRGFRAWSERSFKRVEATYSRLVGWGIGHRKLVIILTTLVLVLSLGLIPLIGTEFMPRQFTSFSEIYAEMPTGTSLEKTDASVVKIEEYVVEKWGPELKAVLVQVGSGSNIFAAIFGGAGTNSGEIDLVLNEGSKYSTTEIEKDVREFASTIPGMKVRVGAEHGPAAMMGGGAGLQVEIVGHDLKIADSLTSMVIATIETLPGVVDVEASRKEGDPEIQLLVDREKAALYGLTPYQVGSALRTQLDGNVATQYRLGGKEYDIVLRLKREQRDELCDVLCTAINGPMGPVLLRNLVTDRPGTSPLAIEHKNTERIVTVEANVVGQAAGRIGAIAQRAISGIAPPPGFSIRITGAFEEMMESFRDLGFAVLIAVLLVFMVMASQFESFRDPFIIIFTIPFALIGVLWALLVTGTTLSVVSGIGVLVLVGIVVNNGIVYVDYVNQLRRKEGLALEDAVKEGGRVRMRPILMTAFTTIFGLLPLALQIGEGSEFWSPLGRAVIGGMIVSTFLTLIFIPVLYTSFEKGAEKRRLRKQARLENQQPA